MVTLTVTTNGDYSEALYISRDGIIGFSIQTISAWTGTIQLQRLPEENEAIYPIHSDSEWQSYDSKTADCNGESYHLAPGWFRIKATDTISGTALCKIW